LEKGQELENLRAIYEDQLRTKNAEIRKSAFESESLNDKLKVLTNEKT